MGLSVNYHHYWTQDFGEPRAAPQPTSPPAPTAPPPTANPCARKPNAPKLLAPVNNAQVNTPNVLLDWNDNVCPVKYRILVKPAITGPSVDAKGGITASQYTTKALAPGNYVWRVRVCNGYGCRKSGWGAFHVK